MCEYIDFAAPPLRLLYFSSGARGVTSASTVAPEVPFTRDAMARKQAKQKKIGSSSEANLTDDIRHTVDAQLDNMQPTETESSPRTRPRQSLDDVAEALLQKIDGATFEDIMKQGLRNAEPGVQGGAKGATTASQAVSKAGKKLKPQKVMAQKKMGFTVQPLESQKMMYIGARGSDSARAFLSQRESRLKRAKA